MRKTRVAASIGLAVITLGSVSLGRAGDACPAQVTEAQAALASAARSEQDIRDLVREAEAACRQGDMSIASRKAQEALGLLKSGPAIGHPDVGGKDPMFIGPTGRTRTGEFGASAWIAPTTPVGSELAGGWRQQSGVPAIGFTFTWGGSSRRPEPVQAP